MRINVAHIREQGIDFVVFDADARSPSASARSALLTRLVASARSNGLKVDKAALAYRNGNSIEFWGTPDLVRFLAGAGVPSWTHTLTL